MENPVLITSLDEWRKHIISNWQTLKKQTEQAKIKSPYQQLIVIAFSPIIPDSATKLKLMVKLVGKLRYCQPLAKLLKKAYSDSKYTRSAAELAQQFLDPKLLDTEEQTGLDWLLMATGTLSGIVNKGEAGKLFAKTVLDSLKEEHEYPSAIRVQAGMISAGQNVVFAGQDVNIVSTHYQGDKAKLKSYLAALRTDWSIPATNIHPAAQHHVSAILHQLYTPVDIWTDDSKFKSAGGVQQLNERRFEVIDKDISPDRTIRSYDRDLSDEREPALEAIATNPLIVITGGAGTGKSSLCRFITTALAYACDTDAEKHDKINGLELLGAAWIHGPMLPLYVSLRDFCNTPSIFPKAVKGSTAEPLLEYIKKTAGSFAQSLESYLTQTDVPTHGTLLVLDGLDEVYREEDRLILQRIIEKWADRFPRCRVIVTSRTYAYRQDARWRLSDRFVSAELAPYTSKQVNTYVDRWYTHLAKTRPSALGGRAVATKHAHAMATNLKKTIRNNKTLIPLARHPLMLALLTLIHGDYKRLPKKRAELYEETVKLLDRWNIPLPTDSLHEKLSDINLEQMRAALKLIAFDLQAQQKHYQRYPTTIQRGQLLDKLMQRKSQGEGLGASIEDVLEYLSTRNGILVSDTRDLYRFPHLSIQEYLAACALIEFYDECQMPAELKPTSEETWTFPENIVALLRHDHSRWRNVVLFAGSITAAGTGQDIMRWQLIDELLPEKIEATIPDKILHSICVATEIWAESYLRARNRIQHNIKGHLIKCLEAIINDDRVDPPDNANNLKVLAELKNDTDKNPR